MMKWDKTDGYSSYYLGIRAEFETRVMYNFCVYTIYIQNCIFGIKKKQGAIDTLL